MSAPRIIILDDDLDVLFALKMLFADAGYSPWPVPTPKAVETMVEESSDWDVALIDMNYNRDTTSGTEGLELLSRLRELDPTLPVIVMTAWGNVPTAVEAMKRGARDYIEKPWQNERLLNTVGAAVELGQAQRAARRLVEKGRRELAQSLPSLIASSKAMQPVTALMERVAGSDASVLITGEHGTGKDVVAKWIHAASGRAKGQFVAVNAGSFSEGTLESELFGHVKGAFTDAKEARLGCFEEANGGTLFLDEIGTMPASQQAKLLRVLQTGEFSPVGSSKTRKADVRVIAATNIDIAKEVERGSFREDLLYRLNTVEIHLPPLRDRGEDLPALAQHFLAVWAARYKKAALTGFSDDAMAALVEHSWPGNVRELQHAIERAVVLAEGGLIPAALLTLKPAARDAALLERMTLADVEAHCVRRAMERNGGNAPKAAEQLGLSRSAFYRRLQALGYKVTE